jgi:hypothetical protein
MNTPECNCYIKKCSNCLAIIRQCSCVKLYKVLIWDTCSKCTAAKEYCCKDYEKSMWQITEQQIFCHNQSAAIKYDGAKFKYCPWCAKKIKKE